MRVLLSFPVPSRARFRALAAAYDAVNSDHDVSALTVRSYVTPVRALSSAQARAESPRTGFSRRLDSGFLAPTSSPSGRRRLFRGLRLGYRRPTCETATNLDAVSIHNAPGSTPKRAASAGICRTLRRRRPASSSETTPWLPASSASPIDTAVGFLRDNLSGKAFSVVH